VGALYRGNADSADASAARFDAEAQSDLRRYNEAQGDVQTANQAMQKVEQFLDQIQQTENATRLTAATFRG
jgi:septation ring formation regulator EzrA